MPEAGFVKPRILDLFCGAGGCGMGYFQAGFEVVGVDIDPQPHYPFEFHQADALTFSLEGFDAIHASPPCQDYSKAMRHLAAPKPRLLDPIRERLADAGVPYVIENVVGAPLPEQSDLFGAHGLMLCGTSFGLRVYRHRLFETSFPITGPSCSHTRPAMNPHNSASRELMYEEFGRLDPEGPWRAALGVGWMNRHEARESVPPAFTRHIGEHLFTLCRQRAVGHDAQGAAVGSGLGVPENDGHEGIGVLALEPGGGRNRPGGVAELVPVVGHNTVHTDAVGERESGHGPHHAKPATAVKGLDEKSAA